MSIRVMTKVWDSPNISGGSDLLVMLALADWSDDDGQCWPSVGKIAKKVRLSEKQTRRVVHGLIEAGFIEVTAFHQGGFCDGVGLSRRYRINLDAMAPSPSHGREPAPSRGCPSPPPVDGRQTVSEPPIEPPEKTICAAGAYATPSPYPDWLLQDIWAAYVGHYCQLQEENGKPVPPAWEAKALHILTDLVAQGHDQEEVLMKAINSDAGLLLPTQRPSITTPANPGH